MKHSHPPSHGPFIYLFICSSIASSPLSSPHSHGVRLRIVHELVRGTLALHMHRPVGRKDEIQVLERLGHPEALHLVHKTTAILLGDIGQLSVGVVYAAQLPDLLERGPRHVLVLFVAREPVRVVDGFHGFGPQDVVGRCVVEASLFVKLGLVRRRRPVVGVAGRKACVYPVEALWADAGCLLDVRLIVGVGDFEAELLVFLFAENDAAQDEVAASKAGHCVLGLRVSGLGDLLFNFVVTQQEKCIDGEEG